jgi:uncharacterized protein
MALVVKRSRLPGAGKGLFTTKFIRKDAKIIQYRGEIIGWKDYNERVKRQEDGYLFYFNRNYCVDAYRTPQYKARYANDAMGIVRVKGMRNNSFYEIHDDKCFIVASRDIKAGEEILCDYTRDYWKVIRYNLKLREREEKDKKKRATKRMKH